MAREERLFNIHEAKPSYVNGKIVKTHEEDVYDVRLSNGQVEAYIENVSANSYSSGDYVAILIIGERENRTCKIIGRGRKMTTPSSIKRVVV